MSSKMPPAASSPKKTASRGLGRGLSSLLGDSGIATATGATAPQHHLMLLARQRRPGFRMFRLNGLMLGRGSHDAGLIRLVWMNLLRQFGKKALSSRFCCVQPPISHRVISLSQVNGAGGRHNWPKSIRCQRLFVS